MTAKQIFAIVLIFMLGAGGWSILGTVSEVRSGGYYSSLDFAVQELWGSSIEQAAPSLSVKIPGSKKRRTIVPSSNTITADIQLEQRKKGLIWYPTYEVDFSGEYAITNTDAVSQNVRLHFPLPSATATYDHFSFLIDGKAKQLTLNTQEGINQLIELAPGETRSFQINYRTRGLREWRYLLNASQSGHSGRVKNLDLIVTSNVDEIDYPDNSLSPMSTDVLDGVTTLRWQADDLITRQNVALIMPEKTNPGPLSARMSYFAPVCLLFFFVLISALSVIKRIKIHPMHYLFVTAGFFAFHLLFAYLVDVINLHVAFLLSSIVSVALVILYLRMALGERFPWKIATAGQLFYLVLFSYSFFIKGMTGLTVTIGSILTLAILMRLTAKMDWHGFFSKEQPSQV